MHYATRRARWHAPLLVALLLPLGWPAAQPATMDLEGAFTLDHAASEDAGPLDFALEPAAQARLRWLTRPAERLVIATTRTETTVVFDRTAVRAPSDGREVPWTGPRGAQWHVTTEWTNGTLTQTLRGDDLTRTWAMTESDNGRTLTVDVRVTGEAGAQPIRLRYRLVYRRA